MHGNERRSENQRDNDNKLYAWVYAVKREDEGRVPEPAEPEVKRTCHTIYGDEYWSSGDTLIVYREALTVFIHHTS